MTSTPKIYVAGYRLVLDPHQAQTRSNRLDTDPNDILFYIYGYWPYN